VKYTVTIVLCTAGALVAGCSKRDPAPLPTPADTDAAAIVEPTAAEPAPTQTTDTVATLGDKAAPLDGLTYIKGEPVTFEEGKVYVVEFWATWCGPCKKSMPHLTALQKKLKDRGVTVIGITSEENLAKVRAFVTEQGEAMGYTVAIDPEKKVADAYLKAFNQRSIPTAFIVDNKGRVAWFGHPGTMDSVLSQAVDGTLDTEALAKANAEKQTVHQKDAQLLQKNRELFAKYFDAVKDGASFEESRPIAEEILDLGASRPIEELARGILEGVFDEDVNRDYEIALKAMTLVAQTEAGSQDDFVLDRYAMALFMNGKIEEAIDVQQGIIEKSPEHGYDFHGGNLEVFKAALAEDCAKTNSTENAERH